MTGLGEAHSEDIGTQQSGPVHAGHNFLGVCKTQPRGTSTCATPPDERDRRVGRASACPSERSLLWPDSNLRGTSIVGGKMPKCRGSPARSRGVISHTGTSVSHPGLAARQAGVRCQLPDAPTGTGVFRLGVSDRVLTFLVTNRERPAYLPDSASAQPLSRSLQKFTNVLPDRLLTRAAPL